MKETIVFSIIACFFLGIVPTHALAQESGKALMGDRHMKNSSNTKDPSPSEPLSGSISKRIMSDVKKCANAYISAYVGRPLTSLPTCSAVVERFDGTTFHALSYKLSLLGGGGFTIGGKGQYVVNKESKVEADFNDGALTVTGPANGKGGLRSVETLKVADGVRIRTAYGSKDYQYSKTSQAWTVPKTQSSNAAKTEENDQKQGE